MIFDATSRWLLLLLLVLPLLGWRWLDRRRQTSMRFSSIRPLEGLGTTATMRARWLLPVLRAAAIAVLIVALARPQKPDEQTRISSEGIAVQLLVDRSGSMRAMDFRLDGKPVDRLTAVRKVVREFVMGEGKLKGRPDDLIGLIVYGTYADNKCPLTLDHGYLIETLNKTQIADTNEEGQTAIGDAIALGVDHLQALERLRSRGQLARIKSRIMILLTDGESNAGLIDPLKAAELAASYRIKIYTIGAGTNGMAPFKAMDPFGREVFVSQPVTIDEETLRKIADKTGGKYFRANDTDSLGRVYEEIDKLEKTRTEEKRYYQTTEWATSAVKLGSATLPPLLLVVFGLLAVEMVLGHTWLRRLP
jgi:Ca-activated chloride channel family protein